MNFLKKSCVSLTLICGHTTATLGPHFTIIVTTSLEVTGQVPSLSFVARFEF